MLVDGIALYWGHNAWPWYGVRSLVSRHSHDLTDLSMGKLNPDRSEFLDHNVFAVSQDYSYNGQA